MYSAGADRWVNQYQAEQMPPPSFGGFPGGLWEHQGMMEGRKRRREESLAVGSNEHLNPQSWYASAEHWTTPQDPAVRERSSEQFSRRRSDSLEGDMGMMKERAQKLRDELQSIERFLQSSSPASLERKEESQRDVVYSVNLLGLAEQLLQRLASHIGPVEDAFIWDPSAANQSFPGHFRVRFCAQETAARALEAGPLKLTAALLTPTRDFIAEKETLAPEPSPQELHQGALTDNPTQGRLPVNSLVALPPFPRENEYLGRREIPAGIALPPGFAHQPPLSVEVATRSTYGNGGNLYGRELKEEGEVAEGSGNSKISTKKGQAAKWCRTEEPLPPDLMLLGKGELTEALKVQLSPKLGPIACIQFARNFLGLKLRSPACVDVAMRERFVLSIRGITRPLPRFLPGPPQFDP